MIVYKNKLTGRKFDCLNKDHGRLFQKTITKVLKVAHRTTNDATVYLIITAQFGFSHLWPHPEAQFLGCFALLTLHFSTVRTGFPTEFCPDVWCNSHEYTFTPDIQGGQTDRVTPRLSIRCMHTGFY